LSYRDQFLLWLATDDLAETATLTTVTGDTCPCMEQGRKNYSPDWHVANPGEDDCEGTGLINTSTTTINIKAVFSPVGLAGNSIPTMKEFIETIGEIQKDDLFLWGTVNTADGSFADLSGKSEYTDYITKDSKKYLIRDVSDIPASVGQVAHLVRRRA